MVLRAKKKKPYLMPLTARPQDLLVLGPSGEGMVIVYFLLAYEYLGRCQRLVWVEPLALKPDRIDCHHPEILYEPKICGWSDSYQTMPKIDLIGSPVASRCGRAVWS